jgi:hypothetical protein
VVRRQPGPLDPGDGLGCVERGVAREERGAVPVRPDAEQDEVEPVRQLHLRRAQRVDLLLRDVHPVEKGPAGHALVRVRMIGRDDALVAPPDVPGAPVEVELGEPPVDALGRRAAGERDRERVAAVRAGRDPAGAELR